MRKVHFTIECLEDIGATVTLVMKYQGGGSERIMVPIVELPSAVEEMVRGLCEMADPSEERSVAYLT